MPFAHRLFFRFINFCAQFEIKKRRLFLIYILPVFSLFEYRNKKSKEMVKYVSKSLNIKTTYSAKMLRSSLSHLYLITADAKSFNARGKEKILEDFKIFSVENHQYIDQINQANKTVILATFHCASYFLSLGYLSATEFKNKRILFFKKLKPSSTESELIAGLVNAGIDCKLFVLDEAQSITREFIKSINEVPSVLFHMCDIPPLKSRSLDVRWLGETQPVSCGIIDLARLLNAPIFVATYQITGDQDLIKLHNPITTQECRSNPTQSLQKIMAYGESQIRKAPTQWQLWSDWFHTRH